MKNQAQINEETNKTDSNEFREQSKGIWMQNKTSREELMSQ